MPFALGVSNTQPKPFSSTAEAPRTQRIASPPSASPRWKIRARPRSLQAANGLWLLHKVSASRLPYLRDRSRPEPLAEKCFTGRQILPMNITKRKYLVFALARKNQDW